MQEIHLLTFANSHWLLLPVTVTSSFSMLPMNLSQHEDNLFFLLRLNWQQAIMRSHLFSDQAATTDREKYTKEIKMRVSHDIQVWP